MTISTKPENELPWDFPGPQVGTNAAVQAATRYRINVETSTKGVETWSCTVETLGAPMDEVLEKSDMLVRILKLRYPPPVG